MFTHDSRPHPVWAPPSYRQLDCDGGRTSRADWDRHGVRDGKTFTITVAGFDVNGQPTNNILVFDKQ
jgi:hypothetical protein